MMWKKKGYSKMMIVMAMAVVISVSCKHNADISAIPDVSFKSDVQPLIAGNCTMSGCHNEGRRSLISYNDVLDYGGIVAGSPAKSNLYQAIANRTGSQQMPPSGFMSETNIKTIYLWILQGAKNN